MVEPHECMPASNRERFASRQRPGAGFGTMDVMCVAVMWCLRHRPHTDP